MKKIFITLGISLGMSLSAQTSIWYFGNQGGLRFNSNGTTSPQSGSAMSTNEGCTSATDNSGNLLFYADGRNIWHGGNNTLITGTTASTRMLGSPSATQAAIIVPVPGNYCTKFLVFTTEGIEDINPIGVQGVGVSLITISGTFPSHTVTYSQAISILGNGTRFSEKLAVTSDGSGGWWLLAHDFSTSNSGGNTFYKFRITNTATFTSLTTSSAAVTALNANLTTQVIGFAHNTPIGLPSFDAQGQMKFNKNGTKLGLVICGSKKAETYLFNQATGNLTIDRTINIGGSGNTYGFEFAPNTNLAYISEGFWNNGANTRLYQYDLNPAAPSQTILATDNNNYYAYNAMQIGPDNKIYLSGPGNNVSTLSVINSPDLVGAACSFSASSVLISGTTTLGLPTVISSQGSCTPIPTSGGCLCNNTSALLKLTVTNANGSGTAELTLNSGTIIAKKVRITLLNFNVTINNASCKNYATIGMNDFGKIISPFPTLTGFSATPSPHTINTASTFTNDVELNTNSPRLITNELLTFQVKFPPILALSCCSQTVNACFRVEYIDANCSICDIVTCKTPIIPPNKISGNTNISNLGSSNSISETVSENQLKVYPNPNTGDFLIDTKQIGESCKYELLDINQRKLSSGQISGTAQNVSVKGISKGIYFLYVFNGSDIYTEKIVVD